LKVKLILDLAVLRDVLGDAHNCQLRHLPPHVVVVALEFELDMDVIGDVEGDELVCTGRSRRLVGLGAGVGKSVVPAMRRRLDHSKLMP
jgi:hypothetical protein